MGKKRHEWELHNAPPPPAHVAVFDPRAEKRTCSESQKRRNDAESNAVITRARHPVVHFPRMGKAHLVRKADNAVNAARKKRWPATRPRRRSDSDPPRSRAVVRYVEHNGVVEEGEPIELRRARGGRGRDFVVLKRRFAHRKRDKRVSLFVAVPIEFVLDPLPRERK